MANITYNNIVQRLSDFADNHLFIKSFVAGSLSEADIEKNPNYPKMVSVYQGADITDGIKTYDIDLHILDLAKDNDVKLIFQQEIISDAEQILEDVVNDITNGFNIFPNSELYRVESASLLPFDEEFANTLSGSTLSLSIAVPYTYDACDLPLVGVTPSTGECADGVVTDSDGVTTFNVVSGGTGACTLALQPSGTCYHIITPSEYTSYRTNDIGWHLQNGTFDYTPPAYPEFKAMLDTSVGVFPYALVDDNAFGTKNRYTTDDGTAPSDGRANFIIGDFATSTDWYVIDHWLGIGIYVANLGTNNWNGYVDACASLVVGAYSDFRPLSPVEFLSITNKQKEYYNTENIFRRGVVSGVTESRVTFGVSADEFSPAAYNLEYSHEGTIRLTTKTTSSNRASYAIRTDRR